jgi:hypothetical protein
MKRILKGKTRQQIDYQLLSGSVARKGELSNRLMQDLLALGNLPS